MDIVICIGPNDSNVATQCIDSIKKNVPHRTIICIVAPSIEPISGVLWIPESEFPFSKDDMKAGIRSGWYLQQLLKLYAPIVLPQLSDNYLIVDADVVFHNPVTFIHEGVLQFNVGTEYHVPYFVHMKRMHPKLTKVSSMSGICHLMPMKRHIVEELIRQVEKLHGAPFWKVFLVNIDPYELPYSGASEYEMLFSFTLTHFPKEAVIRPLVWNNSESVTAGYTGTYEAIHYYIRK
jgi:hypothetical protein